MNRSLMVLVSGAGSTLENLCAKIHHKHLHARVCCVLANRKDIGARDVAKKWKLPYWQILKSKDYPLGESWDATFFELVRVYKPGMVVLAGFDSLICIPPGYNNRVVNTHPSCLPRYGGKGMYGDRVYAAVLEAGESVTGCTIHLVNEKYDDGKILAQQEVDILDGDTIETLRKRVQSAERTLYPSVIESQLNLLERGNV